MALRTFNRMETMENEVRGAGKSFHQRPASLLQHRAPLGTLSSNNVPKPEEKHGFKKPTFEATKQLQRQPLAPVRQAVAVQQRLGVAELKREDAEVEAMDVNGMTEAFQEQLCVDDIDQDDYDNPQLCAEYVKDIYRYLMQMEKKFHVDASFLKNQPEVNERMRCILIDWLIQVHLKFSLFQETLYLTVSIIDRYLAAKTVHKSDLQLVGVTAMLIASKYEEMYAPEVKDFVYITDNTYSSEQIRSMESKMLHVLDYSVGNPLPLHFLRRNSKAGEVTPEMHTMAKFLLELSLPDYAILQSPPSLQSAAALCLTMKMYGMGEWDSKMTHYSTYREESLWPCMKRIAELVSKMGTAKQQAVRAKYCSSKFLRVAKEPVLKSQIVADIAAGRFH